MPFIVLVGKAVQKCLWLHGLVKCRIKYPHHQGVRHQFTAGLHPHQIGRIMQGRQVITLRHGMNDFFADDNRASELLPSVDQPVSHHVNL